MSTQTVSTLKSYFNTGDFPTEAQFHDLIESNLNLTDGGTVAGTTTMTGELNAKNKTNYLGLHKFQGFVGTMANLSTNPSAYSDNDCLVELGTLDTVVPSGFVAATNFFFSEFVIGITTANGSTLNGNLAVASATGTATNVALTNPTEVVGEDVASVNPRTSATDAVTESDIAFHTAGVHVFEPMITAVIARKFLYARATTGYAASNRDGRFTVAARYSVF